MASLLRKIVAGPRSRHPEAGLDLCYVTSQIIATSGPSGTYPQRAYRNPLDQLVKFLDYKHGDDWAIWEFRAEGTGYPDEEVYGRVKHYPWPDHHPPPFRLVPIIMASMRNWLHGESGNGDKKGRVVIVHCKAGKGRSGTMACCYLISECGWESSEALARFTERRMRPGFGQGVSIPSQLRWVGYVDRWTKGDKLYMERQIEIIEVHVWGLRDGVKVQVEGFVDEGKVIKLFHVFSKKERTTHGDAPPGGSLTEMISDLAGFPNASKSRPTLQDVKPIGPKTSVNKSEKSSVPDNEQGNEQGEEAGGQAVMFKPLKRIILPTSDINIDFERRNKASMGWTMVTSVAHVWFNAYFEGNGPEKNGKPDDGGVFEIDWESMDGIRGSSRKGTKAFDRLSVVWKAYEPEPGRGGEETIIHEPRADSPVPQMAAADWKGNNDPSAGLEKDLGLRTASPVNEDIDKTNSVKSGNENGLDNDSFEGLQTNLNAEDESTQSKVQSGIGSSNPGVSTSSSSASLTGLRLVSPSQHMDSSQVSTSSLPDGVAEEDMKDAKSHKLGHHQLAKKSRET